MPAKARVLSLEDITTVETSVVAALSAENYQVRLTTNWPHALHKARAGEIDVLVLDSDTHWKELQQLAAILNAGELRCRTLVTARSLEQLARASEAGVDAVLMKPLDFTRIGEVVDNLLAGVIMQALPEGGRREAIDPSDPVPAPHLGWGINE